MEQGEAMREKYHCVARAACRPRFQDVFQEPISVPIAPRARSARNSRSIEVAIGGSIGGDEGVARVVEGVGDAACD
eukprot:12925591-Prorocentrum_lima.AAC.1